MRNFWKKNGSKTVEEYLVDCIYNNIEYAIAFHEIPNSEFVDRFKKQFESDFLRLEAQKTMEVVPEILDSDEERKIILEQKPKLQTPLKSINPIRY